jgi:hypothetical protein
MYTGDKKMAFKLFREIVNAAAFNAYVIWAQRNPSYFSNIRNGRKLFLRELAMESAKPNFWQGRILILAIIDMFLQQLTYS